jgi:dienelactone hydrolase
MPEMLLFHHAQGLTAGVVAFADELRGAGHTVHAPDLFGGLRFSTLDEGVAHVERVGFDELVERGVRCAADLPDALVYAGFSLGVMPAQRLAQTRPGARGALLFEACAPHSAWGAWPADVPVQIHGMEGDPFFAGEGDLEAARALVAEVGPTTRAELFTYPGDRHLFTDRSLASHDSAAAALVTARALEFLASLP